jgi:RNA polymerase I-specific transcription initiation factor RRN7
MSFVVIATKLLLPFDEIIRAPEIATDPSSLALDWDIWTKEMRKDLKGEINRVREIKATDKDVFKMSDKELDDYLDWYQKTWANEGDSKCKSFGRKYASPHCIIGLIVVLVAYQNMLDLFPIDELNTTHMDVVNIDERPMERVKRIHGSLIWHKPIPVLNEDESRPTVNRPGSFYRHYRNVDELPVKALAFFNKAGKVSSGNRLL